MVSKRMSLAPDPLQARLRELDDLEPHLPRTVQSVPDDQGPTTVSSRARAELSHTWIPVGPACDSRTVTQGPFDMVSLSQRLATQPGYARAMDQRERETAALLTLLRSKVHGSAWGSVAAEVSIAGSAIGLLDQADDGALFRSAKTEDLLATATDEVRQWKRDGLTWVTVLDPGYPERLRDIRESPPFLFCAGEMREQDLGMSIVGSRAASGWGLQFAADAARLLVDSGLSVLSGLAEGIDATAHRTALDAGGRTVAFLGTGITQFYPAKNRELQSEIAQHGLVLSQFLPYTAPTKQTFPMRNATMSGYGLATIVVEAGEHSGARIQARLAGQHGRPVVLTRRVAEGTVWGSEMATRVNVRVVDGLDDLASVVAELRERPGELQQALDALLTG